MSANALNFDMAEFLPLGKKLKCELLFNPFPNNKFLDSFKLKEIADDNFKFGENVRKFSKWVKNTVGKGEILRYEQFLLFPQCFQKTCTADT